MRVDTRERLLSATQQLLWERGYAATSPKDIQRAADAGQGSMYHHFDGKQELAAAALARSADELRHDAAELLGGTGPALGRLEAYLRRQRESLRGCRIGRMTYDPDVLASSELLDPVARTFAWLLDAVAAVVAQAVDEGDLPADTDPDDLGATVVAVVQGGYVLARARGDAAAFDAAVDGAVALLHAAARPAAGRRGDR